MATAFTAENAQVSRIGHGGARLPTRVRVPGYEYGCSYTYPTVRYLERLGVAGDRMAIGAFLRAVSGGTSYAARELRHWARTAESMGATHVRIG